MRKKGTVTKAEMREEIYACVEESLVSRLEADGVGKGRVRNLHSSGSSRGVGSAGEMEAI